jgi:hypothetical protein
MKIHDSYSTQQESAKTYIPYARGVHGHVGGHYNQSYRRKSDTGLGYRELLAWYTPAAGPLCNGYNLRSCRDTPSSTFGDNGWLHVIRQAPYTFTGMQHPSGPSFGNIQLVSAKNLHNTTGLHVVDISLRERSEFGRSKRPHICRDSVGSHPWSEARFFAFQRVNPSGRS